MVNRILIDTNVLLDYLLTREPFYEDAKAIINFCVDGKSKGCIAAHSMRMGFTALTKISASESHVATGWLTNLRTKSPGR